MLPLVLNCIILYKQFTLEEHECIVCRNMLPVFIIALDSQYRDYPISLPYFAQYKSQ